MTSSGRQGLPRPFVADERADAELLMSLRDRLERWLHDSGCASERVERLLLATNEAVTNAIEHAYADGEPGPVRVRGDTLPDGTIRITVADHGRWRPAQLSGFRGRGIRMMQECGDIVRIARASDGTLVTITAQPQQQPEPGAGATSCRDHFRVHRQVYDDRVIATITGRIPAHCEATLSRELLAASCGGVAPLTIDITGLTDITENARRAIEHTARTAQRVGGRTVLVVRSTSTEPWRHIADITEVRHED